MHRSKDDFAGVFREAKGDGASFRENLRRHCEEKTGKHGAVVFGKVVKDSWNYLYIGPWPISGAPPASFRPTVALEWLLCIGDSRETAQVTRKVLTLFSRQWVVYDRYNKWSCPASNAEYESSLAAPTCLPRVPPNTEMKDGELELDVDTLKWYEKKEEERELVAEEARADQGEVTFAVGECLRTSWLIAQRAEPLMCMFTK